MKNYRFTFSNTWDDSTHSQTSYGTTVMQALDRVLGDRSSLVDNKVTNIEELSSKKEEKKS